MQETPESVGVPQAPGKRVRDGRGNDPPGQPAREQHEEQRHVIFHYRDPGSGLRDPARGIRFHRIPGPGSRIPIPI